MKLVTILSLISLSACALFDRHPNSGYLSYPGDEASESHDIYELKAMGDEHEAREELGLLARPLTNDERLVVETRLRLKRQEERLATKREKKQYFDLRSGLKSDRDRLYFLSLPNFEARERWAQNRGLAATTDEVYSDDIAKVVDANDIAVGMSQKAVMESWGDPDAVEIAGDPVYGYERWKYNRYISGSDGYEKELRIVYFEGGRVVGWERP